MDLVLVGLALQLLDFVGELFQDIPKHDVLYSGIAFALGDELIQLVNFLFLSSLHLDRIQFYGLRLLDRMLAQHNDRTLLSIDSNILRIF